MFNHIMLGGPLIKAVDCQRDLSHWEIPAQAAQH